MNNIKIKEGQLDTIVYNPYTNHPIQLRFLPEPMYIHMIKHYPELYEEVIEEVKTPKIKK